MVRPQCHFLCFLCSFMKFFGSEVSPSFSFLTDMEETFFSFIKSNYFSTTSAPRFYFFVPGAPSPNIADNIDLALRELQALPFSMTLSPLLGPLHGKSGLFMFMSFLPIQPV